MTLHSEAAVIVGAGYSYVGGLPLANTLFACAGASLHIPSQSARERLENVYFGWIEWSKANPGKNTEQFL